MQTGRRYQHMSMLDVCAIPTEITHQDGVVKLRVIWYNLIYSTPLKADNITIQINDLWKWKEIP